MKNIRKHFPVLKQYLYANTASAGLLSEPLMNWRQEHDLDYLIGGSNFKTKSTQELLPKVRETVASFFKTKVENIALIQNFSLGMNMLLDGLEAGTKVLLVKDDYPSLNWPFEGRNFDVRYARLDTNIEQNILESLRQEKVSVLALSIVHWATGIKIKMDFLRELKDEFPDLLIIADGTQFCGTVDFDFETSPIDVMGASAYKWLLAGYGNGFMLIKDSAKALFQPKSIGFYSANSSGDVFKNISLVKRLEPGHLDTLNFGSLQFSLNYLNDIGLQNIESYLGALSEKVAFELSGLGLLEDDFVQRKNYSTIFNIKGNESLFQKLTDAGVLCSQRGAGLRLSFHCYNDENDIEQLVNILKSVR